MNFVEQLFGFAPDNGSGMLELMLFAIPLIVLCVTYAARASARKRRQ